MMITLWLMKVVFTKRDSSKNLKFWFPVTAAAGPTGWPTCPRWCWGMRSPSGANGRKWLCPCESRSPRSAAARSGRPAGRSRRSCCRSRPSRGRTRSERIGRIGSRRSAAGIVERFVLRGCRRGRRSRLRARSRAVVRKGRRNKMRRRNLKFK